LTTARAPGKVILFGEHAVVYGRPAIAVPVAQVRATAMLNDASVGHGLVIDAPDLGLRHHVGDNTAPEHPAYALDVTVRNTLARLGVKHIPDLILTVSSTIPVACGLGSGAAIAAALVRVLSHHLGSSLSPEDVSALVYQTELIHHGTPSGIDNTVVSYERPVYFVRGQPIELLHVGHPFWLVIGDTGAASPTRIVVADVRRRFQERPDYYNARFDEIGAIARQARQAIVDGHTAALGPLMTQNHQLLQDIDVSSSQLDALIEAALGAGALGAKLCGAGRGGNMVALVEHRHKQVVADALLRAGAGNVIVTRVAAPRRPFSESPSTC